MVQESHAEVSLDDARKILDAQPFSLLIGASLERFGEGGAELRIPLRAELRQQFGFAHGGLLAYAVDNALTFAGGTALGPAIVSRGFSLEFVRPAQGVEIRAVATVLEASSRSAVCRCDVFDVDASGDRALVAVGQGTISRIERVAA